MSDSSANNSSHSSAAMLRLMAGLSRTAIGPWSTNELLEHFVLVAAEVTGATRGFVALAEEEVGGLVLVATAGEGWTDEARINRLSEKDRSSTLTSLVARTGAPVRVANAREDVPGYAPFFPEVHAVMAVPIALDRDERVRGVMSLESDQVGAFTEEHEAFVQTLADTAALRLAADDLRARETALVQIGKELSGSPDMDAMLDRVVAITSVVLRAEECSLFFIDQATRRLQMAASKGKTRTDKLEYALGEGMTGRVADEGRLIRDRDETGAFLAAPIPSTSGVLGVLRVIRRESTSPWFPNDFTPSDEETVATIAAQLGAAADNARLFARLMQSERMASWGEMSAMSSHMIGNKVFAVKGDLNELEHVLGVGAAHERLTNLTRGDLLPLVEGMKRGIFRLEELLAEFRDFVKAGNLAPMPGDATELIALTVKETFPKRGNVQLVTHYTDEPLAVLADAAKLRRALSEVIENAVTHLEPSGGTVTITTRRVTRKELLPARMALPRGDYALVVFEDDGPGVPEENKERIFRPFVTTRNRGMGLGLAIVKGIIDAHHGGIAETGEPGRGARFEIALPLTRQGRQPAPTR